MSRQWPAVVAGVAVAVLGTGGLIRGAMSQSQASGTPSAAPIVVTGAYVRVPAPPTQIAAAYFTVRNTTNTPDRLTGVQTGAGATATLHRVNADGSMSASPRGAVIPAHGALVLTTGRAHVMIEQLFGQLRAGQTVNIELDFQNDGSIDLVAPVIGIGQQLPTGDPVTPSGAPS
jgi:copper(I)-binding protein